jgi:hypothetical protein
MADVYSYELHVEVLIIIVVLSGVFVVFNNNHKIQAAVKEWFVLAL